jgi:signal transduction histidine kinase
MPASWLQRLVPRRLRWRLVSGFALILGVLMLLLVVTERTLVAQSLRSTLIGSIETTIHAGLVNEPSGPLTQKWIFASTTQAVGGDASSEAKALTAAAKVSLAAVMNVKQASVSPQDQIRLAQANLLAIESRQFQSLADNLAVTDEPVALLDTHGDYLAGAATLSHDRARATHLNTKVLARLAAVAQKHAKHLSGTWTGQVTTADGAYLVVLQATTASVFTARDVATQPVVNLLRAILASQRQTSTQALSKQLLREASNVSSDNYLVVLMARSLADTDATVNTVTLVTVGGGAGVLLIAILLSLYMVGRALRPIATITAGAERLAAGNYDHRLALRAGADEVGRLAAAFDHMAEAISSAFATQRRFVADASHELRTPLTALRGYTDILLLGVGDDPAEQERILHAMHEDFSRISRLVNDLLTLARLDGGAPLHLERVQLTELLSAAATEGEVLAAGTRTITLDPVHGDLAVWADRDRLRQVLTNIVGNACIYTQEGGTVHLRADRQARMAVIVVRDNGPGIAPADLVKLGERFFRGDMARSRQTGGAGLGVAIARGIVQAHGGTLAIASRVGEGTTVTICLPLAPPVPHPAESARTSATRSV